MASDFDERAATWDDDPRKVARAQKVAAAISSAVPVGPTTRLLDYGAGTGLASAALGQLGSLSLAEPSQGMRAVLAAKRHAGVLPPGSAVWDPSQEDEWPMHERFDLIVTVMALHHVVELDAVLDRFAALLEPDGHLCVVDLDQDHDRSFHRNSPSFEGHHGFDRRALARRLEAAGFRRIFFDDCVTVEKAGVSYPMFLATATVAAGDD